MARQSGPQRPPRRMSQQLAISTPPMQAPLMLATMGRHRTPAWRSGRPTRRFHEVARGGVEPETGVFRISPGAEGAALARNHHASRRWPGCPSNTDRNWRHMVRDMALSRPVWRNVTHTTPLRRLQPTPHPTSWYPFPSHSPNLRTSAAHRQRHRGTGSPGHRWRPLQGMANAHHNVDHMGVNQFCARGLHHLRPALDPRRSRAANCCCVMPP